MGHTDRERRRLALQAAILNPLTDSLLRRAGVSAGMSILELGCGIGDVSLIAARLIGPHVELATTTSRIPPLGELAEKRTLQALRRITSR